MPVTSRPSISAGWSKSGAWNISATSGTTTTSTAASRTSTPDQLADVERGTLDRRHHQRAERLALPLALERAAERERAGERDRNPENAGGRVGDRASLADEAEREHEHAGDGEEQRREQDLAAARLDQQILARHEPDRSRRNASCRPIAAR